MPGCFYASELLQYVVIDYIWHVKFRYWVRIDVLSNYSTVERTTLDHRTWLQNIWSWKWRKLTYSGFDMKRFVTVNLWSLGTFR